MDCRQTYCFSPSIEVAKSKALCKLSKADFSLMVLYLTGDAHLPRHNKIANTMQEVYCDLPQMKYVLEDPDDNFVGDFDRNITCRISKLKGKEETPYHLAKECLPCGNREESYWATTVSKRKMSSPGIPLRCWSF